MSQQAMITRSDSHRSEDVVPEGKERESPPAEKVAVECEWNQQMEGNHGDQIIPEYSAILIDFLRPRYSLALNASSDMAVFRNRVTLGVGRIRGPVGCFRFTL